MYIDASRFLVHEGGHRVVVNLDFSRKVRSEKGKLYFRGSLSILCTRSSGLKLTHIGTFGVRVRVSLRDVSLADPQFD